MTDTALSHQLASLDAACRKLQSRAAQDAKSAGLLLCVRSLLVRLRLDSSLRPKLDDDAQARFGELTSEIATALGETPLISSPDAASILPTLSSVVLRLQAAVAVPQTLVRRVLAIEEQYLREYEDAYFLANTAGEQGPVQVAESYSAASLAEYLAGEVFADPELKVDAIEVISGGYSKLTLRARLRAGETIPKTAILRVDRPENQKFVGTRVTDEYPLLVALHESGVRVPRPYALEQSGGVLGAPAIVLEDVVGKTVGDLFDFPPPNPELGLQLARQLALIHEMPESLITQGSGASDPDMTGVLRVEIDGFQAAWNALGKPSAIIEAAFHCVDANMHLASGRRSFIHGDFGLHNILIDKGRITAVLDWEFARLANPAVDFGWFYYTAEHLVGWDRFLSDYAEAGGTVPPDDQLNFYRLWGALRFAVLCCQVDAGFNAGLLAEIDYAVPGNRLLRVQLLRVAAAIEPFRES